MSNESTEAVFETEEEMSEIFDRAYAGDFSDPRSGAVFFFIMEGRPAEGDTIRVGTRTFRTEYVDGRPACKES